MSSNDFAVREVKNKLRRDRVQHNLQLLKVFWANNQTKKEEPESLKFKKEQCVANSLQKHRKRSKNNVNKSMNYDNQRSSEVLPFEKGYFIKQRDSIQRSKNKEGLQSQRYLSHDNFKSLNKLREKPYQKSLVLKKKKKYEQFPRIEKKSKMSQQLKNTSYNQQKQSYYSPWDFEVSNDDIRIENVF